MYVRVFNSYLSTFDMILIFIKLVAVETEIRQCNISSVKLQISIRLKVENSISRDQLSLRFAKTQLTIYSKFATLPY